MPSFLFSPGLPIDFFIHCLFEWDFQGCSPPPAVQDFLWLPSPTLMSSSFIWAQLKQGQLWVNVKVIEPCDSTTAPQWVWFDQSTFKPFR